MTKPATCPNRLSDAAGVAPINKLSTVLVAVRLTLPNWLGIVLIASGAVLVAYKA